MRFTRAAERLFIAASGLSVLIRELESQLGFRLFDRTTRHVAPARAAVIPRDALALNSPDTRIAIVEAGHGIAVVPSFGLPACQNRRVIMTRLINPVATLEGLRLEFDGGLDGWVARPPRRGDVIGMPALRGIDVRPASCSPLPK